MIVNAERMRFAYARGARFLAEYPDMPGRIVPKRLPGRFTKMHFSVRIHPDDEHLQYGPLSTSLREWVIGGTRFPANSVEAGAAAYIWGRYFNIALNDNDGFVLLNSDKEMDMAKLFIAEMLADEGL